MCECNCGTCMVVVSYVLGQGIFIFIMCWWILDMHRCLDFYVYGITSIMLPGFSKMRRKAKKKKNKNHQSRVLPNVADWRTAKIGLVFLFLFFEKINFGGRRSPLTNDE